MLAFIIILIVIGFFVGLIARLLVPGRDNIGFIGTTLLGWLLCGTLLGAFAAYLGVARPWQRSDGTVEPEVAADAARS